MLVVTVSYWSVCIPNRAVKCVYRDLLVGRIFILAVISMDYGKAASAGRMKTENKPML